MCVSVEIFSAARCSSCDTWPAGVAELSNVMLSDNIFRDVGDAGGAWMVLLGVNIMAVGAPPASTSTVSTP